MDCKNCTAQLKDSAQFCTECGTSVEFNSEESNYEQPQESANEGEVTQICTKCGCKFLAKYGEFAPCPNCNGGEKEHSSSTWIPLSKLSKYGVAVFLILFGANFFFANTGARFGGDFYTSIHNVVVDGFSILIIGFGLAVAAFASSQK
ncbi:MAG: zinc-ribbon domain-containing protein [Coriobacteriia bacterium]|nr:zinc-ribbon domain-containing protein [Coriobacteriia bacterium]MCL2870787.1 zinc-ribbon domain-containing protein [Coriobacteriia bacterium]